MITTSSLFNLFADLVPAKGAGCGHTWGGGLLRQLNNLPTLTLSKTVKCMSGLSAYYLRAYASERIPCT